MSMCLHPVYLEKQHLEVDCGVCPECLRKRKSAWVLRLRQHLDYHQDSAFLTITYRNEDLPDRATLVKRDYQNFLKTLRKYFGTKRFYRKIQYYMCGEYGSKTSRPHYHFVFYGISLKDLEYYQEGFYKSGRPRYVSKVVNEHWKKGFNTVGTVTPKSISYVASYCQKKLYREASKALYEDTGRIPPFTAMSKGIGLEWCMDHEEEIRRDLTINVNGFTCAVPRYYRKKLAITAEHFQEAILDMKYKEYNLYYHETGNIDVYIPDDDILDDRKDSGKFYYYSHRDTGTKVIKLDFPMRRYDGWGYLSDSFMSWRRRRASMHNMNLVAKLELSKLASTF